MPIASPSQVDQSLFASGVIFMEEEIWKDIPGYEGIYAISNLGVIRRFDRIKKLGVKDNGYLTANLSLKGKTRNFYPHRLVAIAFIPNPENKPDVNHIDGNKKNNSVTNLEWVTKSENMIHANKTGLTKIGESHYKTKLTIENIKEILFSKERPTVIAKKLGIGYRHFREIKTGRKWTSTVKNLLSGTQEISI